MQLASVLVNLGGDSGNQVPKIVTPAEVAVLLAIHGDNAVEDVKPLSDVAMNDDVIPARPRTNREELGRLRAIYGNATDGDGNRIIDQLYPGAAARVFETFTELALPEQAYAAIARVAPTPAPAVVEEPAAEAPAPKKTRAKKQADEPADMADAPEDVFQ